MFRVSVLEGVVLQFIMARRLLGKNLDSSACYLVDGLLVDTGIHFGKRDFIKALTGRHVAANDSASRSGSSFNPFFTTMATWGGSR